MRLLLNIANEQYGLSDGTGAGKFWKALKMTPYQVIQGKVVSPQLLSVEQLLDSTMQASEMLGKLKPSKNQQEFGHYTLMMSIRVQYLIYESIEEKLNSPSFSQSQMPAMLEELKAAMVMGDMNDRLFSMAKRRLSVPWLK